MSVTVYARYCAACAGPADATRDNVLIVRDRCDFCGKPNKELFRAPARPLPGMRVSQ